MAIKTFGAISFLSSNQWKIEHAEPHVCIRLKQNFTRIPKGAVPPFYLPGDDSTTGDLEWFTSRYPMVISAKDKKLMKSATKRHTDAINSIETILLPTYQPKEIKLNDGEEARLYQMQVAEVAELFPRFLLGDELGLGKTLSGILFLMKGAGPYAVVMQGHMQAQWAAQIKRFTGMTTYAINTTTPFNLPPADVYLFRYSQLSGWSNFFSTGFFKRVVADEIQELRKLNTQKRGGAMELSVKANAFLGMSGTPIYNYGGEIYSIIDVIDPGCLGGYDAFCSEWITYGERINHPEALGTYLRERNLFIRRTRADVGRELPPVNKIVQEVEYDEDIADAVYEIAEMLAVKGTTGNFMERGQALRELDIMMRQATGVSKAKYVAAYVRMIVESGEPVVLGGWHRDVYDIWLEELKDLNPVMYTGTESPTEKGKSLAAFQSGESKVFILSLRSGVGLDGLQYISKWIVFGELDHSPKVHDQFTARIDRDGAPWQCNAVFLISTFGSDPVIVDRLAIKSSQSHGILDPMLSVPSQYTDESVLKQLAERVIMHRKHIVS